MFRSIGGVVDKKKNNLIKSGEKSSDAVYVFNKFLDKHFTEYKDLFEWEISYNSKDGRVVVNTGSKLIAGELSLKMKELLELFKEAKLRVTQVVIG